jgi:hypothetical protein
MESKAAGCDNRSFVVGMFGDGADRPSRLPHSSTLGLNRLVTGNCAPSSPEGAKMLTGADPALDRPMILLMPRTGVLIIPPR